MDNKVLRALSYGLYALGSVDGKRPTGCIINTAFQLTSEPLTLAISVNRQNFTNECIQKSGRFSLSILSEGIEMETIGQLGFQSGRDKDKFADLPHGLVQGLPVLSDHSCGFLLCRVKEKVELSSHTLFIAEVEDGYSIDCGEAPMSYAYYHQVKKGSSPPTAPTYIKEEAEEKAEGKWICSICGYVYDGAAGPFENLPADWVCPWCKADKSKFNLV